MTEKFLFGKTRYGKEIYGIKIDNGNGLTATFIEYGAIIQSVVFKDKAGKPVDIVLGYDNLSGYETDPYFFGEIVGRNANRIKDGKFEIGGTMYQLDKNNHEKNNLHSGLNYFGKRIWASDIDNDSVSFIMSSPDGDQGFPGNMEIIVKYTLTAKNSIIMSIFAKSDADTVCNMTNHVYFNLNGEGCGLITDHIVEIPSAKILKGDEYQVPTGEILDMTGTEFDFTKAKPISVGIDGKDENLVIAGGYDHNYCIDCNGKRLLSKVTGDKTGICLTIESDLPGMQFYTGNNLGKRESQMGKSGKFYETRSGFAIEPQFYPNAVNIPEFDSPIIKAGECYWSETEYILSVN